MGSLRTVKVLLQSGTPLEVKEPKYGGTPLQWALHGSINSRDAEGNPLNPEADYAGVVKALIETGANIPTEIDDDLAEPVCAALRKPDAAK